MEADEGVNELIGYGVSIRWKCVRERKMRIEYMHNGVIEI